MIDLSGMRAIVAQTTDHGEAAHLAALGVEAVPARDAAEALSLVESLACDFVLADLLLPVMDGAALLDRIGSMKRLRTHPGLLLICPEGLSVPGVRHRRLIRPFTREELRQALLAQLPENRPCPPELAARIAALLERIGCPKHRGTEHLARAIAVASFDIRLTAALSRRVYPALSLSSGDSPEKIGRAIRHAIDIAWKRGSAEEQYRLFGNTIDAQRGKPSVGQMLARAADILRLEES